MVCQYVEAYVDRNLMPFIEVGVVCGRWDKMLLYIQRSKMDTILFANVGVFLTR